MSTLLPPTGKAVWTHADYLQLPDDGRRYEVIEGELRVAPSPLARHQRVVGRVFSILNEFCERTGWGETFVSPLDVIFSDITVMQPEIFVIRADRLGITSDWVRGAPDLCAEVLSPSTMAVDRGKRMDAYARYRVGDVWLLDPDARTLSAFRLTGEGYGDPEVLRGDAIFRPALFPGLEINLERVWA